MTPKPEENGNPPHLRNRPVEVNLTSDMPPCPRCGDQVLLTARMPYPIQRSDGHWVHGTTEVLLCPTCDLDDPAAGALITYFHVHGQVDTDTVRQGADLIRAWIDSNPIRRPNVAAIEAEYEAWRRGEL